jgi:dihydropteroate synthase
VSDTQSTAGGGRPTGAADRVYLRPLTRGPGGPDAGYLLAGGWQRFSQCEVIARGGMRRTVSAEAARDLAPDLFARLIEPRAAVAGITLDRPRLMGIVNVTPDSFSDGGAYLEADAAVAHGLGLRAAGADILDIGGESTRPGAAPVEPDEEIARIQPVIEKLAAAGAAVSVDTRRARVMQLAAEAGAALLNDVSGLRFDPRAAATVAELGLPVVIMHSRGTPEDMNRLTGYGDLVPDVFDELAGAVEAARAAGVPGERIVVDPGIGFAKTAAQSAALLADLAVFHGLGCPLLVGASRKSFIDVLTGESRPERRLAGSLAAALWAVRQGAQILRVHDVAETAQALAVWSAIDNAPAGG